MCDYSLHGVRNRLAVQGDQLITFRFSTGSIGLADVNSVTEGFREKPQRGMWAALRDYYCASPENVIRQNVIRAVCVPPGARLRVENVPHRFQQTFGISASEDVTFTQLSAEAFQYRDAVRFRNGSEMLLQRLGERVRVRVIDTVETVRMAEHTDHGHAEHDIIARSLIANLHKRTV
jgi:hypothetical protein